VRIRVTSAAKADLAGALGWYRQRHRGLDHRFLQAFEHSLDAIQNHPEIAPTVEGEVRRYLMRGFPYAVF
jgi:plasmid stabilization system protein ParE